MAEQRTAYLAIAVVLVLLVVIPPACAGGTGTPAAPEAGASPAEEGGAGTPAAPPSNPAPASGSTGVRGGSAASPSPAEPVTTVTSTCAVMTVVPEPADRPLQSGGNGTRTTEGGEGPVVPTATPTVTPATAGGAGSGRTVGGNPASSGEPPAPAATTAAPNGPGPGPAGPGKGGVTATQTAPPAATAAPAGDRAEGGGSGNGTAPDRDTTTPPTVAPTLVSGGAGGTGHGGVAGAKATSPAPTTTATAAGPGAGPRPADSASPAHATDTQFPRVQTLAGVGAPAGATDAERVGTGVPVAGTIAGRGHNAGVAGGEVTARPTANGHAPGSATIARVVGNHSGERQDRTGATLAGDTTPTLGPSASGPYMVRAGAEAAEVGRTRPGGAGHGGPRGGHGPQGAGHGRGPPGSPAAAPAQTVPEPGDRSHGENGRGRRGSPAPFVPVGTGDGAPDPLLLLRFLLFLGYRRVRPGNLLDHPLRRSLAGAIAADPGLDLSGCVAATGANRETLRYHLALLVCGGKVQEETRNGSVRYFPHDPFLTKVHRAVIHLEQNPSLAPALHHIRDRPGIPRRELAALLGVAGPTVTRQVQRLVDEGLVENRGSGLSQGYWLAPECADAYRAIAMAQVERDRGVQVLDAVTA